MASALLVIRGRPGRAALRTPRATRPAWTYASWRRASALLVITSSPGRAALRNPRAIRPAGDPRVVAQGFSPARDHEQPWKGCATKSARHPTGRGPTRRGAGLQPLLVITSSPGRAALENRPASRPAVDPRVVAQGFSPARDHEQPWKGCATKSARHPTGR